MLKVGWMFTRLKWDKGMARGMVWEVEIYITKTAPTFKRIVATQYFLLLDLGGWKKIIVYE